MKKMEDYIFKCEILKKKKVKAYKFNRPYAFYRIYKENRSASTLKNIYYLWKSNKIFNKLNFLTSAIQFSLNIISVLFKIFWSSSVLGISIKTFFKLKSKKSDFVLAIQSNNDFLVLSFKKPAISLCYCYLETPERARTRI